MSVSADRSRATCWPCSPAPISCACMTWPTPYRRCASCMRSRRRADVAEALLGLGGNVGDVRATLDAAVARFADGTEVKLIARSSDYRTPPWGVTDQPPFINCVIAVETGLAPQALLERAFDGERALGRDRSKEQRWGRRAIDIDLLTYDDLSLNQPGLLLPHPRLFERAFVLVPLAEIVPDRFITGRGVRAALSQLDTTGIEKLPPR